MNVFLLTAMRSGSTYLVRMLKDTGFFHYPEPHVDHTSLTPQRAINEYLAPNPYVDPWYDEEGKEVPDVKNRETCINYLEFKAAFMRRQPCLFKILMEQYRYYMLEDHDRPLVESIFPDLKYIWLERSDVLARVVSAYIFFKSNVDHIHDQEGYNTYMSKAVEIDEKGLLDVYKNHVKGCDWSTYLGGVDYLKLEYEDLVAQPEESLRKCLDHLGLGYSHLDLKAIVDRQPKFKTERPESEEWKNRLRQVLRKGML